MKGAVVAKEGDALRELLFLATSESPTVEVICCGRLS